MIILIVKKNKKLTFIVVVVGAVVGGSAQTGHLGSHPGPFGLTYLILWQSGLGAGPQPLSVQGACNKYSMCTNIGSRERSFI